ncbi:MAG TPA: carboxymuconolactone decarboxylase family protein [Burkholderiales bacterium]|nr:carboxymuconolactone decarboxylase family protein [Burkholderiales bacterium]
MNQPHLRSKYGDGAYDAGLRLQPQTFERRIAEYDSLDQHFARLWLDFGVTGMLQRPALDTRTRFLVLIGQFTMAKSYEDLEDTVRAALAARVAPSEILEIILQCIVYGGHTTAAPAIRLFHRIAGELDLLDELKASSLPPDGRDRTRSYEEERKTWHPDDIADPRFERLMARYGWLAAGRGLTLRPRHHLNILAWLDAIDPEFARLWVRFCYQGMYGRDVVDPRTRLLCVVGNCLAIGESTQSRGHMRGAMRNGASPREVIEVILMTSVNFGMPPALHALEAFVQIMAEDGRLAEIGNPPVRVETYSK